MIKLFAVDISRLGGDVIKWSPIAQYILFSLKSMYETLYHTINEYINK